MAGNVPAVHVFANDVGPEALSLLDGVNTTILAALNSLNNYTNYYADTGAVNAMVATLAANQAFALTDGVVVELNVANTTTSAAVTFNMNGTGAVTVVNADGSTPAVGQFLAGQRLRLIYDGTNNWWRVQAGGNVAGVGVAICKFKAATTGRANTVVLTADPDLQYQISVPGTYAFEMFIVGAVANGADGLDITVAFSAAMTTNLFAVVGGLVGGLLPNFTYEAFGTREVMTENSWAATDQFLIKGIVTCTAAGLLSFQWSQDSSGATATNIGAGSYMKITRLA